MWKQPLAYGALGLMLFLAASVIDLYSRNVAVIAIGTAGALLFMSGAWLFLQHRLRSLLGPMTPFKMSLLCWAVFLMSAFMLWHTWQDYSDGQTILPKGRGNQSSPPTFVTAASRPILFYGIIGISFSLFGAMMMASIYALFKVTRDNSKHRE